MSEGEDWEKWGDDDAPDPLEEKAKVDKAAQEVLQAKKAQEQEQEQAQQKKPQQITQAQSQAALSKESDMLNVLDMFGGDKPTKKIGQQDLKKLGDNFAIALNNVGPIYTTNFLTTLLTKLDKKLTMENWDEIQKVAQSIYQKKKKQAELEEEMRTKNQKGAPKGISWGKTKNLQDQMDDDDDDNFGGDDDDFM